MPLSHLNIPYIERVSQKIEEEEVFGGAALKWLYGKKCSFAAHLLSKWPFFSKFYGFLQTRSFTKKKIAPFIKRFKINSNEFEKPICAFSSFNDFFIRTLKKPSRPIAPKDHVAIIPADGRYRFFSSIDKSQGFVVKGKKFHLGSFFKNELLAKEYEKGSLVLARLCPIDYHRFHFPASGIAGKSTLISGSLYSVNPLALKWNIDIYTENKRSLCALETKEFGKILIAEIGATNVGSIVQTYREDTFVKKGMEKGFFQFGGSALALFFLPGAITFDEDLIKLGQNGLEIRCQMGQSMGKVPDSNSKNSV